MLELRKKDGSILALSYSYLERAEYDPSRGITLHVHGATYRILGRNLNHDVRPHTRLYEGIVRQRVSWIQEADRPMLLQADDKMAIVERVEW